MSADHDDDEASAFSARVFFRGIRAAAAVLTRVPVGGFPYDAAEWRWSTAHLPLVGALVAFVAAIAWTVATGAGSLVAAIIAVATAVAATGALHEDGLADTTDALGGSDTPERVFAILKDHGIGAFGACALVLAILLRVATLEQLGPDVPSTLCFVGAASRLAPTALLATLPYVTPAATAKSASLATAGVAQVAVAAAWVLGIGAAANSLGGLPWAHALGALAAGAATVAACGAYFRKRVGGVTGDFLGAAQQLSECAMLVTFAAMHGSH
jgi:adenosylcobinamide-GDP ribazoletransferase